MTSKAYTNELLIGLIILLGICAVLHLKPQPKDYCRDCPTLPKIEDLSEPTPVIYEGDADAPQQHIPNNLTNTWS